VEEFMGDMLSTQRYVSDLVKQFHDGSLAIPEIQRDVVWKPDQVKELVSSVFRGYPCGSLIFWEPREKDANIVRAMIRPERLEQLNGRLPRYFLLDGQQRITALASVILPRQELKKVLAEIEEDMPYIFCNLKRFPKELEATTDPTGHPPLWYPLQEVLSGDVIRREEIRRQLGEGKAGELQDKIERLRGYAFPVQIVQERTYQEVAEVFALVNSQGTSLTGAEIHLARLVPRWNGISKVFRDYRKELKAKNYDLDLSFLMRSITAVECGNAAIAKLTQKVDSEKLTKAHLKKSWRQAQGAISKVIATLSKDLNLDRSHYFPSKNVVIPIVYYVAKEKGHTRASKQMLRFFLNSQLSERYGGGAETMFRRDFRILADQNASVRKNLEELAEGVTADAKQYYRGLRIKPADVSGPPSKNVILMLMYILMRQAHATDWGEGRGTPLNEIEPSKMQIHHIFPFNFMVKDKDGLAYADRNELKPSQYRREINDIANMTFLSQPTNARIGDSPPWTYLPNETSKDTRRAHFIPEEKELWHPSRFGDFLAARRELIARAATTLLKPLK
jgi:hypothetical protein